MKNLYKELIDILTENNKTINNIEWIGTDKHIVSTTDFLNIAKQTNYESGFGAQKVAKDLLIVGNDFWIMREQYDGSEWFEFYSMPTKPVKKLDINCLDVSKHNEIFEDNLVGWISLEELQKKIY